MYTYQTFFRMKPLLILNPGVYVYTNPLLIEFRWERVPYILIDCKFPNSEFKNFNLGNNLVALFIFSSSIIFNSVYLFEDDYEWTSCPII